MARRPNQWNGPTRRKKGQPTHPGKLLTPHGPNPWHFQMGMVHGNGFNGQIRHAFHPGMTLYIPGKGYYSGR